MLLISTVVLIKHLFETDSGDQAVALLPGGGRWWTVDGEEQWLFGRSARPEPTPDRTAYRTHLHFVDRIGTCSSSSLILWLLKQSLLTYTDNYYGRYHAR